MDAVQNAALRLYTMDESLFPSNHELAWLHTVVKNEALMALRKKKPEHDSVDELPEVPVPERQLEMLEDMETVQAMLSSLDPKRQNVVTLKVLGGLSHKEIAQLLSMPVGTVQWHYNTLSLIHISCRPPWDAAPWAQGLWQAACAPRSRPCF